VAEVDEKSLAEEVVEDSRNLPMENKGKKRNLRKM
jgi:hypothetical protein